MSNNLGNKETMARNIKYYMDLNSVSSVDMCKILDVPASTFSYWINARTYPRIDKIERMANYFGVSKADLVEERIVKSSSGITLSDDDEQRLVLLYRRADEIDKGTIRNILSRYDEAGSSSLETAG